MACLLYIQLFLMTTLTLVLNMHLYPAIDQILSGIQESSLEEEGAQEALNTAVIQYKEKSKDLYLSRVVEVKGVRKQTKPENIFIFNVTLGKTTCMKNESDLTNCPLNKQTELQSCTLEITLPSWMDDTGRLEYVCDEY